MIDCRLLEHPLGGFLIGFTLGPVPRLLLTRAEDGEDQELGSKKSRSQVEHRVPGREAGLQDKSIC